MLGNMKHHSLATQGRRRQRGRRKRNPTCLKITFAFPTIAIEMVQWWILSFFPQIPPFVQSVSENTKFLKCITRKSSSLPSPQDSVHISKSSHVYCFVYHPDKLRFGYHANCWHFSAISRIVSTGSGLHATTRAHVVRSLLWRNCEKMTWTHTFAKTWYKSNKLDWLTIKLPIKVSNFVTVGNLKKKNACVFRMTRPLFVT